MSIIRDDLRKLFKLNPDATLVRGPNILYVDTGKDKVLLNVRQNELNNLLKGVPHTELKNLSMDQKRSLNKEYHPRSNLNLRTLHKGEYKESDIAIPRVRKEYPISNKMLTYPEATGVRINTIVNDFFTKYLSQDSSLGNKSSLKEAFKEYAKTKKIPVSNKDLNANNSIFKQVEKTWAGLNKHKRIKDSILKHGTHKKVLKATMNTSKTDSPSNNNFAMTQKVLEADGRYIIFTDKNIKTTDTIGGGRKNEAVQIGTTMQEYFKVDKPIVVVTPKGTVSIVPKGNKISVNGFDYDPSIIGPTDVLHAFNETRGERYRSTVASSEAYYANTQKRIQPEAIKSIARISMRGVQDMTPAEVKEMLATSTVKDVKNLMKSMQIVDKNLEAYTINDDVTLDKVLPRKNYKFKAGGKSNHLAPAAPYKGKLFAKEYDWVMGQAFSKKKDRQNTLVTKQYADVVKLGKRLNVNQETIDIDLANLMGSDYDPLSKHNTVKQQGRYANTLLSMQRTFTQSLKLNPEGSRTMQWMRGLKKVGVKVPKAASIVNALKDGKAGEKFLRERGLLDFTLANPSLNVEGNMQSGTVTRVAMELFKQALKGDTRKLNPEAVTRLGELMSPKDLDNLPELFKTIGKHHMPSLKSIAKARREVNWAYEKDENGLYKRNIEPSKKSLSILSRKAKVDDAFYDLTTAFGGKDDIEGTFEKIRNDGKVNFKEQEAVIQAFVTDPSELDNDLRQDQFGKAVEDFKNKRASQIGEKNEVAKLKRDEAEKKANGKEYREIDDWQPVSGEADLTNVSSKEGMESLIPNKNVFIQDVELDKLGGLVNKLRKKKQRGTLGLKDFAALKDRAITLGYKGNLYDVSGKHGMLNFIGGKYDTGMADINPGLISVGNEVKVNLTTALYKDMVRQNKESAKKLGADRLNLATFDDRFKSKFTATKPDKFFGPDLSPGYATRKVPSYAARMSKQNMSTIKFLGQYKTDWSHLLESFHGDKIGKTSMYFGDPDKANLMTKEILNVLGRETEINGAKHHQLETLYSKNVMNGFYTNRELDAYEEIKNGMVDHPTIVGKKVLSKKLNPNKILDMLLEPYNLPEQKAAAGQIYTGKKAYHAPAEPFVDYFNPRTRKWHREGGLTQARHNQALIYLDNVGAMSEFQTNGMKEIPDIKDRSRLLAHTAGAVDSFVERHMSPLVGKGDSADKHKIMLKQQMKDKITDYGVLINKSIKNGEGQTALSYLSAVGDLQKRFKSEISGTSLDFANDVLANPNKGMNRIATSSAREHLVGAALREAEQRGAFLLQGQEPITKIQLTDERLAANAVKAGLLKYDKIDYEPEKAGNLENVFSEYNTNKDPLIEAELKSAAKVLKQTKVRELKESRQVKSWIDEDGNLQERVKDPFAKSKARAEEYPTTAKQTAAKIERVKRAKEDKINRTNKLQVKQAPEKERDHIVYITKELPKSDFNYPSAIGRKRLEAKPMRFFTSNYWRESKLPKHKWVFPKRFSSGGKIPGKGVRDEVPALLTKGEVVLDRTTSEKLGIHSEKDYAKFKQAVKDDKVEHFATGGFLGEGLDNFAQSFDEWKKKAPGNFNISFTDNSSPTINYNLSKTPKIDVTQFKPQLSTGTSRNQQASNMQQITKSERNQVLHLAANKAWITMDVTDLEISDNLKSVAKYPSGTGLTAEQITKAQRNFADQIFKQRLNLDSSKMNELSDIGSSSPTTAKDVSQPFYDQIKGMGAQNLDDTLASMEKLGMPGFSQRKKSIQQISRLRPSAVGKLSSFEKNLMEVEEAGEMLAEIFNKDSRTFKNLSGKSPYQIASQLQGSMRNTKFENVDAQTSIKTPQQLRQIENALTAMDKVFSHEAFSDRRFSKVGETRAGIQDTRSQVNQSRSIREHSRSRISEFGALTLQNAAFGMSYALIGGVQQSIGSTVGFMAQFDDAMKNLQAITGDSADGLDIMSHAVKQVSTETKFSALEISEAATILGQAGFSAVDISKSLDGVVQLATATGSNLEEATQVLTSTLTIWDKSLSDSKKYANEFTAAINESKLDITSLTGAIQYTGNIAASAGIPVTDVLTMTSLLKDAGIKRPSTLGTGQRLLYSDFASPTKKFTSSLKSAGIELEDFQKAFDTKGVAGALKIMKDAGYGLAQASKGMEVREKSIYIAEINQLDKLEGFRESITGTNAAFIANETQMEGLGNSFKNMLNSWQINLNESMNTTKGPLGKLVDALTIEVKKKDPKKNLGVEGYTLEERNRPQTPDSWGVAAIGGAIATGFTATFAPKYIEKTMADVLRQSQAAQVFGPGAQALGAGGGIAGASKTARVIAGFGKTIQKLDGSFKTGALAGALSGVYGAATAEEGSRTAAIADTVTTTLSFITAHKALKGIGDVLSRDLVNSKWGMVRKVALGTGINSLLGSTIGTAREKGESSGTVAKTIGTLGTAAEWGAGAFTMTKNPWIIGAATLVGGLVGYNSELEASTVGLSKGISNVTNDLKAVASEFESLHKAAVSLEDLSNYAMRPNEDSSEIEKISKFRLVADNAFAQREKTKTLEAVIASRDESFTGFNYGDQLMTTPERRTDTAKAEVVAEARKAKGKPLTEEEVNKAIAKLPSVVDNLINIQEFYNEGVKVKSRNKTYEGNPADAAAKMFRSAEIAAINAQSAKGGAFDKMFFELLYKPIDDLIEQYQGADTEEKKSAVQEKFNKNISEMVKYIPLAAVRNADDLRSFIKKAGDAREVQEESLITKLGKLIGSDAYDSKSKNLRTKKTIGQIQTEKSLADLDRKIEMAGANAPTADVGRKVAEYQVRNKQRDLQRTGKPSSMQDAWDAWIDTPGADATLERVRNLEKTESGLNKLLDTYTTGRAKLDNINVVAINMTRKLSIKAANDVTKLYTTLGPELTNNAMVLGKVLSEASDVLSKSFRQVNTRYGMDLEGQNITDLVDKFSQLNVFRPETFKQFMDNVKGVKLEDNTVDVQDNVNVFASNKEAIDKNTVAMVDLYKQSKSLATDFVESVMSFDSLSDAIASGAGIDKIKAYENLSMQIDGRGITKQGFDVMKETSVLPLDTLRQNYSASELFDMLTLDKQQTLKNNKQMAVEKLTVQTLQAAEIALNNYSFQQEEIKTGGEQAKDKAWRRWGYQEDRAEVSYDNNMEDVQIRTEGRVDNALVNFGNQMAQINVQFDNTIRNIEIAKQRGYDQIHKNSARAWADVGTNTRRKNEDIDLGLERSVDKLNLQETRQKENVEIKFNRGMRDIATNTARAFENLAIKQERGLRDIVTNTERAFEDLAIKTSRAYEDLALKGARAYEDLAIKGARGREDLQIKEQRGREDLADKRTRGFEDMATKTARAYEDIEISRKRSIDKLALENSRRMEDFYTRMARATEDLDIGKSQARQDLDLKKSRSIEDAYTNYADTVAAIGRNFERNIAAIERSREDTINAFNRSLDRPQVITLNPESLSVIADNLGDVSLALDAHKAALTANTTAVKQNSELQKSQEDIVADAYKDAYKKVGGEVYKEDGSVNEDFTKAYDEYMAKNSEGLVDAVLANALSAAFAGISFDIGSALTDASYIANAVATPSPGMTMPGATAGSGLTVDELVAALYSVKSNEVRVTTTAGVILEAQGGMEGALFDLETAMISINIKLREAAFSMEAALTEAGISLTNNLRDIELNYQRALDDLSTSYARSLETLALNFARGLEDLRLNTARTMQDLDISIRQAFEDLSLSIGRAGEDLEISLKRAGEDLDKAVKRAGEDLNLSLARGAEDIATSLARGAQDIAIANARGVQDIARAQARAMEDLATTIADGAEDIVKANAEAIEDLKTARADSLEDIAKGVKEAGYDLALSIYQARQDLETGAVRAKADIIFAGERFRQDVEEKAAYSIIDAGNNLADNMKASWIKLQEVLYNIGKSDADGKSAAVLNFERTIAALEINYYNQIAEIDIAVTESLGKLKRGFDQSMEILGLNYLDQLNNLQIELDAAVERMFGATGIWARQLVEKMIYTLNGTQLNTAGIIASWNTQIETALKTLKIDANAIVTAVATSFKTALESERMKQVGKVIGPPVEKLLVDAFKNVTEPVKVQLKKIDEAIKNGEIKDLAQTLNVVPVQINKALLNVKTSTVKYGEAFEVLDKANEAVSKTVVNTGKLNVSYKDVAEDTATITSKAATAGAQAKASVGRLEAAMDALGKSASNMSKTATTLSTEAQALYSATAQAVTSISTLGYVGTTLDFMANQIALAAKRAVNTINAAVAAAKGAGMSTGGSIPGYGGGDTVPIWLEPGEFVLRKEIVRELGVSKLNEINSGGDIATSPNAQVVRLPSGGSGAISVQMNVQSGNTMEVLEQNMERIADGVKKVFEEYS